MKDLLCTLLTLCDFFTSYAVFDELSDPMQFEVYCVNSSRQFGDQLSGFGSQSEKFSRIGACIRRNLTP